MYFITLFLLLFIMINIINATPEILVFARGGWSERFPLELPMDATLQDLHDAIVTQQQLNTTTCEVVLSFQGEKLDDLQASLADTGIGMESTVDFNVVSFIPLSLYSTTADDVYTGHICSQHFIHDHDHDSGTPRDFHLRHQPRTLYWNPNKDLTQFKNMRLNYVQFKLCETDGMLVGNGRRLTRTIHCGVPDASEARIANAHSFWIVPTQDVDEDASAIDFTGDVLCASDLRHIDHAHDIVLKPSFGQRIVLAVHVFRDGHERELLDVDYEYVVPKGYCLLLKHKKKAYNAIIDLKYHRGIHQRRSRDNQYVSLDTAHDFGEFAEYNVPRMDWRTPIMHYVSVHFVLRDKLNKNKNLILFPFAEYKANRILHRFWIRPNDEIRQEWNSGQFKPGTRLTRVSDFNDTQYAKDMALIPAKGETLYVHLQCREQREAIEYLIPNGYGLWLQYRRT